MMIYNHTGELCNIKFKLREGSRQGWHRDQSLHLDEPSHQWKERPSRVRRTRQPQREQGW